MLPDVSWYSPDGRPIDWNGNGPSLTSVFGTGGIDNVAARPVMLMLHAGREPQRFAVPPAAAGISWGLLVDTAAEPPHDVYPEADGPTPGKEAIVLDPHTLRCYVAE
jgi:glycogen operon protein